MDLDFFGSQLKALVVQDGLLLCFLQDLLPGPGDSFSKQPQLPIF